MYDNECSGVTRHHGSHSCHGVDGSAEHVLFTEVGSWTATHPDEKAARIVSQTRAWIVLTPASNVRLPCAHIDLAADPGSRPDPA